MEFIQLVMCEICGGDTLVEEAVWRDAVDTDGKVTVCPKCDKFYSNPDRNPYD